MDEREVAERTEAYLRRQFNIDSGDRRFGRTVDLFEGGYVDSLGLVELLQFIQDEFDVEIPDEDILSDDFTRIDGIARIVCRRGGT
jgi:acyl carrier protein